MTRADSGIHHEVAKFVATMSNRLSAIKTVGPEGASLWKLKNRNETSEGSVGRSAWSSAGPSNVGGSSS